MKPDVFKTQYKIYCDGCKLLNITPVPIKLFNKEHYNTIKYLTFGLRYGKKSIITEEFIQDQQQKDNAIAKEYYEGKT